jgi:hypothetical protein
MSAPVIVRFSSHICPFWMKRPARGVPGGDFWEIKFDGPLRTGKLEIFSQRRLALGALNMSAPVIVRFSSQVSPFWMKRPAGWRADGHCWEKKFDGPLRTENLEIFYQRMLTLGALNMLAPVIVCFSSHVSPFRMKRPAGGRADGHFREIKFDGPLRTENLVIFSQRRLALCSLNILAPVIVRFLSHVSPFRMKRPARGGAGGDFLEIKFDGPLRTGNLVIFSQRRLALDALNMLAPVIVRFLSHICPFWMKRPARGRAD